MSDLFWKWNKFAALPKFERNLDQDTCLRTVNAVRLTQWEFLQNVFSTISSSFDTCFVFFCLKVSHDDKFKKLNGVIWNSIAAFYNENS